MAFSTIRVQAAGVPPPPSFFFFAGETACFFFVGFSFFRRMIRANNFPSPFLLLFFSPFPLSLRGCLRRILVNAPHFSPLFLPPFFPPIRSKPDRSRLGGCTGNSSSSPPLFFSPSPILDMGHFRATNTNVRASSKDPCFSFFSFFAALFS